MNLHSELYLSDVLQERILLAAEFDPLWAREAAAGLHTLILQRRQAPGKDGLPWDTQSEQGRQSK